ncbi:ATP-dependent helicase HrpB [Corynebacterium stationis]|uniref:ATP-dependent helicase HrpB n=1 Tax=Corynebacterium stationis TaxID=1705 RepID=UPI000B59EBA4|nr:ATP-dependent helicase HrpB [Corynebacterium stationis]ASJ17767.1 ATP-dependent helicase HrpB [Corynebacterium stationis]
MSSAFNLTAIGQGLPVANDIDRLPQLIAQTGRLVVQAPPGTGKTTLVPPALANHSGKVLVTAPRRVAVRAAARRLAQLDGRRIGDKVGFSIRGEHHPGTHVEFMTPGVLLRRLLTDPELTGVNAVAIDEVHERQLDTDLVLAMLLELAELRDDLSIVAMSATLDAQHFATLMNASVLDTPAVTYPLDTHYAPHPGRAGCTREFLTHLATQAQLARETTGHSVLVFVPGVREVKQVCMQIPGALSLHGRLSSTEQDQALRPSDTPRIVVSTSIAESSLTVPGVRAVIDSGLSRVPRRDAARGMTGLVTISAAQSTVDQRAGRAGREGPGTVIRAYSQSDYQHAAAHITPEIATSDLTEAALLIAAWGGGADFPLPDKPPHNAWMQAQQALTDIGAVQDGTITALGTRLSKLPLHPRLGRALLECGPQAAETIAVLSDSPSGNIATAQPPQREVKRLRSLVKSSTSSGSKDPGVITGLAFPQRIAKKVSDSDYLLASGTRAWLPPEYNALRASEWLSIAEVSVSKTGAGKAGSVIRAAATISERDALDIIGIEETLTATFTGGKLQGRAIKRAGAIELSSTPVKVPPEQASAALADGIRTEGLSLFIFSGKAQSLRERLNFLHAQLGEPWPDVESSDPEYWLGPELDAMAHGASPKEIDMYQALQRLMPWPEANSLEDLAPARLSVPSGSHPRIDYSTGRPVARVKLQECFGLSESPECAGVRVQFHLLSPAGRPLAVTDDLKSFWSGPYAGVRADMRGRYPKHPWPEDPWTAQATARTKNRM